MYVFLVKRRRNRKFGIWVIDVFIIIMFLFSIVSIKFVNDIKFYAISDETFTTEYTKHLFSRLILEVTLKTFNDSLMRFLLVK